MGSLSKRVLEKKKTCYRIWALVDNFKEDQRREGYCQNPGAILDCLSKSYPQGGQTRARIKLQSVKK